MAYDGSLKFDTKIDQTGFTNGIASIKSVAMKAISAIGIALSTGAIVQGMFTVGKEGIALASNLKEVQNVVDVTFGEGAEQINEFAKNAKISFGLSELAAKQFTGTIGAMLKSMGLVPDAVAEMSTGITGLAGDFASFYNITSEDAFQKIRAGISGETEPLRQLGINMSVANLEAYALAQGIDETYASMTQAQQATLRYNYLMSVSADAQGDFARTSDSYANSQRLAALATDELKAAIGTRLLPIAAKFQQAFADIAGAATEALDARGVSGVVDVITDKFPGVTAAVSGLAAAFTSLMIIKGVTAVMVTFQTAQVSLALGMMGTTAAALVQSGALTANEIIVGALTGKITLATAAQALWNAVMLANPIGLMVTAIGLLVGSLVLINKNFDKINPQMAQYTDATKQASQQTKQLSGDMRDSAKAYEDASVEIEKQEQASRGLIDTLYAMSAAYQGSSIEQRKMQAIVDELNGTYAGLNLAYDSNTGKVNQNKAAVESLVAAKIKEAKATADIERSVALIKDESDAKYNLYVAQDNYNKLAATGASKTSAAMRFASKSVREAQTAYDEASAAVATHNDYLSENGTVAEETTQSIDALKEAERGLTEETQNVIIGGYEFSDKVLTQIGITADDAATRLDNFTGAATNMFEKINTESKLTVADMIANLQANAIAIEDFGDNVAYLGTKLPKDLLQPLIDAGPEEMAGVVSALAGATDEELSALVESFANGGEEAKEAWLNSLGAGTDGTDSAFTQVFDGATQSAANSGQEAGAAYTSAAKIAIEGSDISDAVEEFGQSAASVLSNGAILSAWYSAGAAFAQRCASGLAAHTWIVVNEAKKMAQAANAAFFSNIQPTLSGGTAGSPKGSVKRVPFATGINYVPYDNLPATLHMGEAVLTKEQAKLWRALMKNGASSVAIMLDSKYSASARPEPAGNQTYVNAPITVQGVTESPTQLSNKITKQFVEVLYGRNS